MLKLRFHLLGVIVLTLASCVPVAPRTEIIHPPSIALETLLLDLDEMPSGWKSYPPFRSPDELCYYDCITIQFDTEASSQSRATQDVYVYETVADAKQSFDIHVIPTLIGDTPFDWTYKSKFAQKSDFACYRYENVAYPVCEWVALYDRYIVDFYIWLVPTKMSLVDLERIINIIDEKMSIVYLEPTK